MPVDRYFGLPVRRIERRNLVLHEAHHPQEEDVPWHRHDRRIVTVVLGGNYIENRNGVASRIDDGCVVVHDECEEIEHFLSPARVLNISSDAPDQFGCLTPGVHRVRSNTRLWDTLHALRAAWDGDGSADEAFRLARDSIAMLCDNVREEPPLTPRSRRTFMRLQSASQALIASAEPLAQVAIACGFADQSHLTRVFSSLLGMPPAAYRKRFRRSPQNVQDSRPIFA